MTDGIRDRLIDWSVPVTGGLLACLSVWNVVVDGVSTANVVDVALPVLVGLALLGFTPRFWRLAVDPDHKIEIVGAAAVIGLLSVGVMAWEQYLLIADGVVIPAEERPQTVLNGLAIGLAGGGVAGYYRARTKQELRNRATAEQSYREIFEGVDDAVLVQDFETSAVLEANEKAADLFGYSRADLVGKVVPELTAGHPDFDMDSAAEKIQAARAGDSQRFDWLVERADGTEQWVEISLRSAELNGEERLLAMLRDISERRRREAQLEALADERYDFQEIFDKADVGIALTDPETRTIGRVNERYAELFGYDVAELQDMRIADVTADDPVYDDERAQTVVQRALDGDSQQVDWPMERKDGSRFWAEVSLKQATIGGQDRLLTFVRDATERKRRERELAELADARQDFQEIFDKADVGVALDDPETGTFDRVNDRFAEMLGYEPADLENSPITEISADDPGFDETKTMALIEQAMAGEPQQFDWLCERRDGSTVWTEVSLKRSKIGGEDKLVAFVRDASQRKEREQALQRHRDEMEFFNSLLRHDVLNAVTVIRTHGKKLTETLEGEELDHAEMVVDWADNVSGVVKRVQDVLETLTGDRDQTLDAVDLSEKLRAEVDRLSGTYDDVTIEADIPDGVRVEADDLLGDVFGNVLSNAVDHNDTEDLTITATVDPGPDTVTVRVADTGSGIPDEYKEAAFRRGETGHVKKTGSGFGLFFVDSMVGAYGGEVWLEDNEPTGTVVVMELPADSE